MRIKQVRLGRVLWTQFRTGVFLRLAVRTEADTPGRVSLAPDIRREAPRKAVPAANQSGVAVAPRVRRFAGRRRCLSVCGVGRRLIRGFHRNVLVNSGRWQPTARRKE